MPTTTRNRSIVKDQRSQEHGHFALLPGSLAYIDAYTGLVPCKVMRVDGPGEVTVLTTASRPGYPAGEYHLFTGNDRLARVIPRTMVYRRSGQYRIAGFRVIAHQR